MTDELREKIFDISLTPINDIYYVPPGMSGSVGLSDKKIDQIVELFASHDKILKQKLLAGLPEKKEELKGREVVFMGLKQNIEGYNKALSDVTKLITEVYGE